MVLKGMSLLFTRRGENKKAINSITTSVLLKSYHSQLSNFTKSETYTSISRFLSIRNQQTIITFEKIFQSISFTL